MTNTSVFAGNRRVTNIDDPPAWLVLLSVLKLLAAGVALIVGGILGLVICVAIACAYIALAAIFITLASVAFTPACGFVALLLAIWLPISLFTAA